MFDARVVERLISQYNKKPRLIIAVDFDDTVFDYHKQGHEFAFVISLIKRCKALGFYIVMFTASQTHRYPFIRQYMSDLGIEIDGINENVVPGLEFGTTTKMYYNVLLDDRAGLGQAYRTLDNVVSQIEEHNQINDTNETPIAA